MSQTPFIPVPVQTRADGWTPEKQWRFVEALAQTASVTEAVRAVGMTTRSAHRLRQHPEAGAFRAAWDAALRQVWGQLEQVALDRAINGEREVIERDGFCVAERHKPCSDKLLIYMLAARERAMTAQRAERMAAYKVALEEARFANAKADFEWRNRRRRKGVAPPPPPVPVPLPVLPDDDADASAAITAFRAHAAAFAPLPEFDAAMEPHLAGARAADGAPAGGSGPGALADLRDPAWSTRDLGDPEAASLSYEFLTRPRWEDHLPPRTEADYPPGAKVRHR